MERVLLPLLAPLIVSFVLFWAIKKAGAEKKTRSIKKFTVECPRVFKNILLILAPTPAILGLLLLLRFGVGEGVDTRIYIFILAFSGSILLLLLVVTLLKLDVENDILIYRSFVGRRKEISSNQVDKVVLTNQSLIIYANGKRFGSLSRNCLHTGNFKKYCEGKGIPILSKSNMINRRQTKDIKASEYVIRRPMYWPLFLIFFLMSVVALLLDTPPTETNDLFGVLAMTFYSISGFSIWIPITVLIFALFAINSYKYFRFKLVIHEHYFTVTPLFGATHDVAFSSIEKVIHSNKINAKGYHIDIEYDNKKIHIPYILFSKRTVKRNNVDVLLKNFRNYNVNITEPADNYPFGLE